jgi:hypothetical protein
MSDRLRFALKEKNGKWTYTTLVEKPAGLVLHRGETGRIFSWSGTKDKMLLPNQSRRPTRGERLASNRKPLARRRCAQR